MSDKKIFLACDYRGVELRDEMLSECMKRGLEVEDLGIEAGSKLDYVDITKRLVERMREEPESFAVLVCGSGQGVAIYANRYNHMRATMCRTAQDAESVRSKLNANVMCLGSKYTTLSEAMDCLDTFIETPFKIERHGRCATKLDTRVTEHKYDNINLIVRAIIRSDDSILLTRATKENTEFSSENYFLPGGHVDHGESAVGALKRELKEEIGCSPSHVEFTGMLECCWERNGLPYHELNLIYLVNIPTISSAYPPQSMEPFQEFVWYPISKISECKLLPEKLIHFIKDSRTNGNQIFLSEINDEKAA